MAFRSHYSLLKRGQRVRKLLVFAAILVAAVPCCAQSLAKTHSDQANCDPHKIAVDLRDRNPEVLKQVEDQWIQAYGERNAELLRCVLADDFEIASMPDEKLEINNKQHVMDWIASKTRSVNKVEQINIKSHGEAAVVRGVYSVFTPEGKLTSRFQFTDIFIYRANGWQAVVREIVKLSVN